MPEVRKVSPRNPGTRMSVATRRQYAEAIRAALAANPNATVEQLQAAAPGAPHKLATEVRRLWRERRAA